MPIDFIIILVLVVCVLVRAGYRVMTGTGGGLSRLLLILGCLALAGQAVISYLHSFETQDGMALFRVGAGIVCLGSLLGAFKLWANR
mgnify:CR=1 FL=1